MTYTAIETYADVYLKAEAESEALAEKIKALQEQKKAADVRMQLAEATIREKVKEEEYITDTFTIKYKKSTALVVEDPTKIPKQFQKVTITADKKALKEALKNGPIEGVKVSDEKLLNISRNA